MTFHQQAVLELLQDAEQMKDLEVDLESQTVIRPCGQTYSFDIDPFRKNCLLNGFDDIGLTMQKMEAIRSFEGERSARYPWLDGATTRVPRLFPVNSEHMPEGTSSHSLVTPTPEEWRAEVRSRRAARRMLREATGGQAAQAAQ